VILGLVVLAYAKVWTWFGFHSGTSTTVHTCMLVTLAGVLVLTPGFPGSDEQRYASLAFLGFGVLQLAMAAQVTFLPTHSQYIYAHGISRLAAVKGAATDARTATVTYYPTRDNPQTATLEFASIWGRGRHIRCVVYEPRDVTRVKSCDAAAKSPLISPGNARIYWTLGAIDTGVALASLFLLRRFRRE
jgi:hypothetical protein